MLIYEDNNFSVTAHDNPHHSRENGGHIVVKPKKQFINIEEMDDASLAAMVNLAKHVGSAMKQALANTGIDIVRINYQINGNWAYFDSDPKPFVHLHLYGRTVDEKHPDNDPRFQAFPEALCFPNPKTGYYKSFNPLTEEDCKTIQRNLDDNK